MLELNFYFIEKYMESIKNLSYSIVAGCTCKVKNEAIRGNKNMNY